MRPSNAANTAMHEVASSSRAIRSASSTGLCLVILPTVSCRRIIRRYSSGIMCCKIQKMDVSARVPVIVGPRNIQVRYGCPQPRR